MNVRGWNMTFNRVAADDGCMARLQVLRHAELLTIFRRTGNFDHLGAEAVRLQMFYPFGAAATRGSLVDLDRHFRSELQVEQGGAEDRNPNQSGNRLHSH